MTTISDQTISQAAAVKGRPAKNRDLYRMLWRWHFYAGVFCIPFVLMLAVTGSIYLFKPQIDRWVDAPYRNLDVGAQRLTPDDLIGNALEAVPGSSFVHYQLPESERTAVIVAVALRGEQILVYLNPYSGDVLKTIGFEDQFTRVVRTLHGELLAGTTGSVLVELAGCWTIVLIITGLYLWWPRNAQGLAGVLYPRFTRTGRPRWRDLHAVTAFWIAGFALFLLISGLPWSLVWGKAFSEVRQIGAQEQKGHHHQQAQMWTNSRAEERASMAGQSHHEVSLSPEVVATAQSLGIAAPALLSVSKEDSSVWRLTSDHQNRTLREDAWLDANGGALLRREPFREKNTVDKIVGVGVSAHEGQLFGWPNQLLGLFTTSGLIFLSVSGLVLWRKRKPQGGLGAPPALPNATVGKVVSIVILALAVLLPLLAASLTALLLLEWLVFRRIQGLRQWLGLADSETPDLRRRSSGD